MTQIASRASDWRSAPKPDFPSEALKTGSEGSVRLRIVLAKDGSVTQATISKSSEDRALDELARKAVLEWKMKPDALKLTDLTSGREIVMDFRQEAPIAVVHPDRVAAFATNGGIISATKTSQIWMFAPFPSYPLAARARQEQGTVLIRLTIGKNGEPESMQIARSSGYPLLDQSAIGAVRLWRAHKEYVGLKLNLPINFGLVHRPPNLRAF
ncbi:MAG TPA: energy transducer TonB [Candidatus Udaeobacter sp.]|nr:energy transducer TonB [Candidatus Udaeobacter sp.]